MVKIKLFKKIKQRFLIAYHANRNLFYISIFLTFLLCILLLEVTLSNQSLFSFFSLHQDTLLITTLGIVCGLYWVRLLRDSSSNFKSNTVGSNSHDRYHQQNDNLDALYNTTSTPQSQESVLQSHYRGIIFNKGHRSVKTYLIPQDTDYSPTYLPNVQEKVYSETERQVDLKVLKRTSSHSVSFKQPILQTNPLQYNQFSFLFSNNHLSLN